MSDRLSKHVSLVTGGASGIGNAIAERLAREGATVVISDIDDKAGKAAALRGGFLFVPQDVCDESQWLSVVGEVERRFGRLTILVNNAGIVGPSDATDPEATQMEDWKRIFAVNVDGVFLGCRTAIPAMRRAGNGAIINMSSVAGLLATPYATAYGASKAAVRQLTKSVAQHCAEYKLNIRCNSVHPGNVRTPLWDRFSEQSALRRGIPFDQVVEEGRREVPLGDFTTVEDIAATVAFLASRDARHITGAELIVDGGLTQCDTFHLNSRHVNSQ